MTQNVNPVDDIIVGIDVSKDKLDVMILPLKSTQQIDNKPKALQRFLKELKKLGPIKCVAYESTGGYERELVKALYAEGIPCHVAHPNRVYLIFPPLLRTPR